MEGKFIMENNENLVANATENVETATEQTVEQVETPKTYTDEEVNQIVGKKLARQETKLRKEYDRKYGELENVLRAGTGVDDVSEMASTFRSFYEQKGIEIPKEPKYSSKDIEILAKAEAKEFINSGFEDVIEEADRLNELGVENMTPREKALFIELTNHIKTTESSNELEKLGVGRDVYSSDEFKTFASQFNSNVPIADVVKLYNQIKPKKEIKTMGSVKNTVADTGIKDFYTPEEAKKFTLKEIQDNPLLASRIEESMKKWKQCFPK
jgi:hypothetical protein